MAAGKRGLRVPSVIHSRPQSGGNPIPLAAIAAPVPTTSTFGLATRRTTSGTIKVVPVPRTAGQANSSTGTGSRERIERKTAIEPNHGWNPRQDGEGGGEWGAGFRREPIHAGVPTGIDSKCQFERRHHCNTTVTGGEPTRIGRDPTGPFRRGCENPTRGRKRRHKPLGSKCTREIFGRIFDYTPVTRDVRHQRLYNKAQNDSPLEY